MKHNKNFLLIISVTIVLLTIFVVFSLINKKPIVKPNKAASLSKVSANDSFRVRPLTNIKYERTAQRLKQGQYLTAGILQCFTCHSPRNWQAPGAPPIADKLGSGGTIVNEDSTSLIIAPNITSDKETGAGNWTDDMLARSIREGVGHDGRALAWQMPYYMFRNLSDEDLASVIVYLQALRPVHHVVPATEIPKEIRSEIEKMLSSMKQPVSTADFSDPMKRGKYLVTLGECVGCHTSHSEHNPGLFAGGNFIERFGRKAFSANITTHLSGMSYGPEGLIFVLRTGKGGTLSPIMPWVAFKNMTDDDLRAIYAYVSTFPASKHYVSSVAPLTHCVICGMEHGLGDKNKLEKLAGIKLNPEIYNSYAGTYFNEESNSSYIILKERNKLMGMAYENGPKTELIPQSELHFLAPSWPLPISFIKDKNGNVTQLAEETDFGRTFKKIK
ncbi:MAG: hypothetical protein WKG06_28890 [Segetibacter sp.]